MKKMKKPTNKKPINARTSKIIGWAMVCIMIFALFGISFTIYHKVKDFKTTLSEVSEQGIDKCANLDIFDTSNCLRKEVGEFYNYNISNVGKTMTNEELKIEGGVCSHYADYYGGRIKELGFNYNRISIEAGEDFNHAFAAISNDKGYCILDQIKIFCFKFADSGEMEE